MAMNELFKMTAHQVKEGNFNKAILAIGSCEAHGQHIAEGCDTLVSYKLSKQIADQVEGMLVLPPITVGYSGHYDSFPFTLTLSYDTTTQVIYDIVESCIRQGIDHIFLMNGHDGNIAPIEVASRKIKEVYPQAQIAALTQWWVAAGDLLPKDTFEVWGGLGHAGEGETSIAYHLFGDWCEPELATSVVAALKKRTDIAIGNVIGSNIFNLLAVLGLTATIAPVETNQINWTDMLVMLGTSLLLLPFMRTGFKIGRGEGGVLLVIYIAYTLYLIV